MKILWLSHLIPYPPKGGVLQRAYHLLREAAKYHEVDLLAFHQPNLMRPLVPSLDEGIQQSAIALGSFCNKFEFIDIDSDTQILGKYRLALKSLLTTDPYNINWLKSARFTAALQQLLESTDYDLVHLDTISLLPYLPYVKHLPTVLDHHNIESHMLLRRADNEHNLLKKWYFRQEGSRLERFEKKYCPQVSLNITCSEIDQQRLQLIAPGSRVEEIPNGVDINFFNPDLTTKQDQSLLFIGRLSWYPNIQAVRYIAHEIWPAIKAELPDISIDIIGANPPKDVQQLSFSDKNFRVHGFVDDISPYFNKAAIYLCPITDGGGTKLKVLDALAMGKALIANKIACEGIKVTEGENVIFAETADEYVKAIKLLLNDESLRRDMGINARQLIENEYSYEKVGVKLSMLYEQCLTFGKSDV